MKEDPQDIFRQMEAMIARLLAEMNDGNENRIPGAAGYHIIIRSSGPPGDTGDMPPIRSRDAAEPVSEIHRVGGDVKVVVELPGVSPESLNIQVDGRTLTIDAMGSIRGYHTSVALPPADPASMRHSLKNGVLEVTFRAREDAGNREGNPD